jgi:hypothetical protein
MFDAPIYICVQNMAFRIVIGMMKLTAEVPAISVNEREW